MAENRTVDATDATAGAGRDVDATERGDLHGRHADKPTELPRRAWRDVAMRVKVQMKEDNATILAGGVAFFSMLSLFPALTALLSLYGLIADPADVARHVDELGQALPDEARQLLTDQLDSLASSGSGALSLGLVTSVALALWSASSATKQLLVALSTAYDEAEERGFIRLRLLAATFTVLAIVALGAFLFVLTALPGFAGDISGDTGATVASLVRWPILLLAMLGALAVLYRHGPDRDRPRWRWVTVGSVVATVVWLLASIAFSFYASNIGSYDKTYGTLASVIVLMLWLYLTALCVILGAEINAEMERQTVRDSTTGPDRPIGSRDAEAADSVGATYGDLRRQDKPTSVS
jgi:membrane protein